MKKIFITVAAVLLLLLALPLSFATTVDPAPNPYRDYLQCVEQHAYQLQMPVGHDEALD
ncbi:hypothetical protein FACS1894208_11000 [Clostridia bacterium]|nr:hypothetical protein FACS1894208_11000 [Clostridia bacterium]